MPLNQLYNAVDPQGVVLNADVFGRGSYPGEDPFKSQRGRFPDAYRFAKTFVSPSNVVQGSGNGVTSIDDPTYLGFSLRFDISSPLFNTGVSNIPSIPKLNDNSSLFTNIDGSNTTQNDQLIPRDESAIGYLLKVGETTRADYLRSFIQGIREINFKRPYYWQTIEGLPEAWNKTFNIEDPYSGSTEDEGITIGCLEALDLKISALFNLYKAAVYDAKYKRIILPKNLINFNVYVDILEIRKFKTVRKRLTVENPTIRPDENRQNTLKLINENTASITFLFEDCVWDLTACGTIFGNVTNNGTNEMAVTSMKWKFGRVEIESQFPGYGSALKDSANLQPSNAGNRINTDPQGIGKKILDNAKDGIENAITTTLNNTKKGVVNKAERVARSLIQNPLLGNVYGQRNQILNAIRNPQFLVNAVAGAAVQFGLLPDSRSRTPQGSQLGDSVFSDNSSQELSPLNSSNVFDGRRPSGPSPLTSNNVFR